MRSASSRARPRRHAADTLRRDLARNLLLQLDQDEPAVAPILLVQGKHRVPGRPAASKGAQNQRVFVRGDLQDALNQARGLGSVEGVGADKRVDFIARLVVVSCI